MATTEEASLICDLRMPTVSPGIRLEGTVHDNGDYFQEGIKGVGFVSLLLSTPCKVLKLKT